MTPRRVNRKRLFRLGRQRTGGLLRRSLRFIYAMGGIVTALVLLCLSAIAGALFLSLPPAHDAARIAGLSAPASVAFDRDGIPRIRAATAEDGAAALGWVQARDRLFQMELMRRAASGRVSELAGPATLPLDRTMRVLGLRRPRGGVAGRPAPRLPAACSTPTHGA